ncbi:MAG TPA: hypothetical protein VFJ58_27210 [Armatimonadota bacterium]|nr:hypothetical protein [Armatimonadota bacterium]
MQRATLVGQEATEWCAGLPLVEVRPLADSELTALRSEARKYRWWGVLALLSLPLTITAFWLASLLPDSIVPNSLGFNVLVILLILAGGAIFVISPILTYKYLSRAVASASDTRAGCLKRFEGCVGEGTSIDGALTHNDLLRADASARQWLELLPSSGRLWSANSRMAPFWITLRTTTVANTPANAYAAAREINNAEEAASAKLMGERILSAKEREELAGHIERAWGTNAAAAVLLTAWLSFVSLFDLAYLTWPAPWFVLVWACSFVITIWIDLAFIKGVVRAYRLNRDRKTGKALMISLPGQAKDEAGGEAPTREIETLPYSRSLWSSSGAPAGWRKTRI